MIDYFIHGNNTFVSIMLGCLKLVQTKLLGGHLTSSVVSPPIYVFLV